MEHLPLILSLALPFGGWILYVERRLSELLAMKETLKAMDSKIERLVDHLLDS